MSGFVKNVCAAAHIRHQLAHSPGSAGKARLIVKLYQSPSSAAVDNPTAPGGPLTSRARRQPLQRGLSVNNKIPRGASSPARHVRPGCVFLGQKALKWDFLFGNLWLFGDLWNRTRIGMSLSSSPANADDSPSTRAQSLNRSDLPGQ